jgi:hypothetical protein
MMLLVFGFATFDTYNLFQSESGNLTPGEYFVSAFLAFLFLLCFISLSMVVIKSQKSFTVLNIFYGLNILLFLGALLINEFNEEEELNLRDRLIFLGLNCVPVFLVFLINKFKYKEVQYENIESIGTHND